MSKVAGRLRPSQAIHTYGIGSIVDLPGLSVAMLGLDDWKLGRTREIHEPRLLSAVVRELGPTVERLVAPPAPGPSQGGRPTFGEEALGLPVAPFPRHLRCPRCNALLRPESGVVVLKHNPYRPDQTRYVHVTCGPRPPAMIPARFLVACESGHIDEFPWSWFVHRGNACPAGPERLQLSESGIAGEVAGVFVVCLACDRRRSMADASGEENRKRMPFCRGRRPELKDFVDGGCRHRMKIATLGASNLWFPVTRSALSLPVSGRRIEQLIEDRWVELKTVAHPAVLNWLRDQGRLGTLGQFTDDAIWEIVRRRRDSAGVQAPEEIDLRRPEWRLLSAPENAPIAADFRIRISSPPVGHAWWLRQVVLLDRLREVSALIGFTRIDPPADWGRELPQIPRAPLSRKPPTAVPAGEVRGEGIFLHVREDAIARWIGRVGPERPTVFVEAHRRWCVQRKIDPILTPFPGLRFVFLHTLAHALMRLLSLECGYSAASVRERLYVAEPSDPDGAMAGILLYTAAPDSEGTLGGLVRLGEPSELGRHLDGALESMRLCASDPLCAEHLPASGTVTLHGAACHACQFAPETSCEAGNRLLDRTLLVPTLSTASQIAFFSADSLHR